MKIKYVENPLIICIVRKIDQTQKDFFDSMSKHYRNLFVAIIYEDSKSNDITRQSYIPSYSLVYSQNKNYCKDLIKNSNIIILSNINFSVFRRYFKNKLIIKISEKFYKTEATNNITKIKRRLGIFFHYKPYMKYKPLLFSIGQYAVDDVRKYKIFKNKVYKFAYFSNLKSSISDKPHPLSGENKFCWIGRFVEWKDPLFVIRLAECFKRKNIESEFVLYGNDSTYKNYLDNIVIEKKLENYVKVLNLPLHERVYGELKKFDYSILSSNKQEGWGLTTQDAMSQGVVPIANISAGSTIPLVKDHINGIIYDKDDPEFVFNQIIRIDKDVYKTMSMNCIKFIKNDFDVDIVSKRIFELYKSISKNGNYKPFTNGWLMNLY